jgi:hypothetical protein
MATDSARPTCALCRTPIRPGAPSKTVESLTYHPGCWDRKTRAAEKKKA